ncbi:MAG: deoxyribose-phosphate aldolase, partial [Candidatus Kariarchaeaceae archaeon]
ELATFRNIYKASLVCMMAGADFIKTSTGKEKVNATLPVGLVMMRAIREYFEKTNGNQVGLKAAGGISDAKLATQWLMMLKEELNDWLHPKLFRIGHYSARHHQPLT